jgi:hypothetical protein
MTRKNWLALVLALTLAGSLALGDLTWAQGRGARHNPQCPAYQSGPGQFRGRGTNYTNCPNYPAPRNCPRGQTNPPGPADERPQPLRPPGPQTTGRG